MALFSGALKFAMIAGLCGLSFVADRAGLFSPWNQSLSDLRMSLSQKDSDAKIVFVAVDSASLSNVGTWPWSRSIHASLLEAVTQAGAVDVLFDFDFTFPGDAEGDQAFAEALELAGGATYLAVFEQIANASDPSSRHINSPLPEFAALSWPALVNVGTDAQGLVRHYPYGAQFGDEFVPSAGAMMANDLSSSSETFEIDFSIRAETIPVFSANDVLKRAVPPERLAGRTVIFGASAIELSDQLAIPVQGIVPGPLVHALAAETLARGLEVKWLRSDWLIIGLGFMLLCLNSMFWKRPLLCVTGVAATLFSVEIGGLLAFRTASVVVPSAVFYPGLIGFSILAVANSLQTMTWALLKVSSEARNTLCILERVFDDGSDGIVILKKDGTVLRQSASAVAMFGLDDDGQLLLPKRLRVATPQEKSSRLQLFEFFSKEGTKVLEYNVTSSRVELPTGTGKPPQHEELTTIVLRDVTQLKQQEQDIAYLSNYDDRTGALRRNAFLAFLGLRLEGGTDAIVFALTLDRFKTINVTLGRIVGDAVLKEVVARLEQSTLQLSAPARLGGTSFAFYTESAADFELADQIATEVANDIGRLYRLKDVNAQIGVRIGYTLVEESSDVAAEKALEQAVEAMDSTKQSSLDIAPFDPLAWQTQMRAREIERALEGALRDGEFELYYQPQHRVSDGALIGAEALIRWNSSTLGHVYPDEFIGIAETTGFIVELGKWTLEQAARDVLRLPKDVSIAVNISGIQILKSDLVMDVASILKTVGVPPHRICLELTETVMLTASQKVIETMQDLRFLGVSWALDDFGTGFSSMEYLSKMPLDKVKLDKSFTMKLGVDPTSRPILHSTAELCRGLGVKLLCEGVETKAQLAVLKEEGCIEAQGYYFSRPVPIEDLLPNDQQHFQS